MTAKRRRFGKVRKRESGRYQASFTDPAGRRRYAPHTFATKAEANDWLTVQESTVVQGDWRDPDRGKVSFGTYATRWIDERPGLRPRTVELYRWLLKRYLDPTFGGQFLSDITPAAVRRWRADLLQRGVSEGMVAKAYRLMRAVLNTAVEHDELIKRNPCRIQGGGAEKPPERPVLSMAEVFMLADKMPERFRCVVLLATFASLRFGEVAALTRQDVDLEQGTVRVRAAYSEVKGQGLVLGPPKSRAGMRVVSIPRAITEELQQHLEHFADTDPDAVVFTGPKGAPLRRGNFNPLVSWRDAVASIGRSGLHFHDLRHTGNTLAAASGASTRDLMTRMGHDSMHAALIYQHATTQADRAIAQALDKQISRRRRAADDDGQQPLFGGDADAV